VLLTPVVRSHQNRESSQPAVTQQSQSTIRLSTEVVSIPVTVTDRYDRYILGLGAVNFELYEDKVKQKIEFFSETDAPLSIGIVFDTSGSMKPRIGGAQAALRRLLDASNDNDDYFLITFGSEAKLAKDFTNDPESIANTLSFVSPKGSTALYDGVYLAVEKVRQGRHNRHAIIIISDGEDNNSRYTYRELKKLIRETDVEIYAIAITDFDREGIETLEQISRTTGGRAFVTRGKIDLEDAVNRISSELRQQYSLGYVSQNPNADGRYRKVRVAATPIKGLGKLFVRSRDGYFAQMSLDVRDK